jgi:transcription elongation GreA/GreB family factor
MNIPSKESILKACRDMLLDRIAHAEKAMNAAQESSNSEDKSSAGDKYETSRAMGQLDRNMNAKQLFQAQHELQELHKIDIQPTQNIRSGALLICNTDIYFIAIGLGPITVHNKKIIVLSSKSPLALAMWGKRIGDNFTFNQRKLLIKSVL